jgi:hypothetical protein
VRFECDYFSNEGGVEWCRLFTSYVTNNNRCEDCLALAGRYGNTLQKSSTEIRR